MSPARTLENGKVSKLVLRSICYFSSVRAGDITKVMEIAPLDHTDCSVAIRGEGRAPEIPVTKSERINERTRKHTFFCWFYTVALLTELLSHVTY